MLSIFPIVLLRRCWHSIIITAIFRIFPLEERARSNFDDPAALEHELLIEQVAHLADGTAVQVPTYDFSVHTRTGETQSFEPATFVIIEGLFSLHWPELRRLLDTRVYVDMTDDICLQRRQERDVRERGRTPESVVAAVS